MLYSGVCWIQMNSTMIHIRVTFYYQLLFITLRACCCILIALRPHILARKKSFRLFACHCKQHTVFLTVSVDTIVDRFSCKKLSNSMNIFRYVTLRFRVRPPLQKSRRKHRYYMWAEALSIRYVFCAGAKATRHSVNM